MPAVAYDDDDDGDGDDDDVRRKLTIAKERPTPLPPGVREAKKSAGSGRVRVDSQADMVNWINGQLERIGSLAGPVLYINEDLRDGLVFAGAEGCGLFPNLGRIDLFFFGGVRCWVSKGEGFWRCG